MYYLQGQMQNPNLRWILHKEKVLLSPNIGHSICKWTVSFFNDFKIPKQEENIPEQYNYDR